VFSSPLRDNQGISGKSVANALARLFASGQLDGVTVCVPHDLRRTLITRLPDLGFEPFIAHKIAGHALQGIMAVYNHNSYEQQRQTALYAWAERLEVLTTSGNVTQLKRA
jgi:integrase